MIIPHHSTQHALVINQLYNISQVLVVKRLFLDEHGKNLHNEAVIFLEFLLNLLKEWEFDGVDHQKRRDECSCRIFMVERADHAYQAVVGQYAELALRTERYRMLLQY